MASENEPKRSINRLANGLGIAAVNRVEQHQLEELVVGQRLRSANDEALLEALAVAAAVVGFLEKRSLLSWARTAVFQAAAHGASPSFGPQAARR
jgi:hypothetical protein